jgi:hypothetical protein
MTSLGLAISVRKALVCTGGDAGVGTLVVPILGEGAFFGVFPSLSVEKSRSRETWDVRLPCSKAWPELLNEVLEIDRRAAGRIAVEIPADVGKEQSDRTARGNVQVPVINEEISDSIIKYDVKRREWCAFESTRGPR